MSIQKIIGAKVMHMDVPLANWFSDPRNKHIAELRWAIKNTEAKLCFLLSLPEEETNRKIIISHLEHCASLYSQLQQYYPLTEKTLIKSNKNSNPKPSVVELWQQLSSKFKQSIKINEKALCIAHILNCLDKLIAAQKKAPLSGQFSRVTPGIEVEQLSTWFLSLVELIHLHHDNPSWESDYFQQLSSPAYHKLYQILTHPDTAHLMFHIYYYKIYPEKLSPHSKHPDFLVSLDQRLSFLYPHIEKFIETFISFSKTYYQLTPQNFLCHGNQLPNGITLHPKKVYQQLIIKGLKKSENKTTFDAQTTTREIIETIFRSYQFRFNPCRLLDAVFMLCKRFDLSLRQPLRRKLYNQLIDAFQFLETDDCIHLYGYFSNNDTRYLLRVLYFIGQRGTLTEISTLTETQIQIINYLYQALTQIIDAIAETLNIRNLPCNAIKVDQTSTPPTPSKRNLQAILHVFETYSDTTEIIPNIDNLFEEIENNRDTT